MIESVAVGMFQFAVCDDEPAMSQEISGYLTAYLAEHGFPPCGVSCFSSGHSLLEDRRSFDVIFLDIQMERPDGMETARLLRRRGERSLLVFVTILSECVFDAFDVEAFGYLTKPLDSGRFRRTMDRVLKALEDRSAKSLVIQRGAACEIVSLSNIVYCEVQGRKIYVHKTGSAAVSYYGRLEELEHRVDRRFFKCHRSYLVNLDYVRGCQAGRVLLPQGESIPVSRLRERELTQALLRRMKVRGD